MATNNMKKFITCLFISFLVFNAPANAESDEYDEYGEYGDVQDDFETIKRPPRKSYRTLAEQLVDELVTPLSDNIFDLCRYREIHGKWPGIDYLVKDRSNFKQFGMKVSSPDYLSAELIPKRFRYKWVLVLDAKPNTKSCESVSYKISEKHSINPEPLVITGNSIKTSEWTHSKKMLIAAKISDWHYSTPRYASRGHITAGQVAGRIAGEIVVRATAEIIACVIVAAIFRSGSCR